MNIVINNKTTEALNGETVMEAATRAGCHIPSLCYAKEAKHQSSCMVCAVKNLVSGQIIPSCTTLVTDGMQIDTSSDEVMLVRRLSLELLLSDHRADCDAPCTIVCPKGLNVELMLRHYDLGQHSEAHKVLCQVFSQPATGCDGCKAPCEKACRRGTVDKAVQIREIVKELGAMFQPMPVASAKMSNPDKNSYRSLLGRFSDVEKKQLAATSTASRCLHCACAGQSKCKLRMYATQFAIKKTRYTASSSIQAMNRQHIGGNMWFEPAKCIRCGLCVYNSKNGFTFMNRGFNMEVVLPDENRENVSEQLAQLCPTGALYLI